VSLPIRWRLTLFIALVIGVILLVLGTTLYLLNRAALLDNIEDTARRQAAAAAQTLGSGEGLSDAYVEQLAFDGVAVIVRDDNGEVLRTENLPTKSIANETVWRKAIDSGESATGTATLTDDDPYYVYAVPIDPPGDSSARVVEAVKPYEPALETLEVFGSVLLAGIGSAFILSIGGAYLLARTALRPIDAVTDAARGMGEGDLSKRLPVANPRDEVGRLATTINGLLSRLEAAFARREEALERQRRFTADASHELRTPLTTISGHARMLDEWALEEDPERSKRSVGAIRGEAGRMRSLVESLLALSRGDEDAGLDVGRHDLADVAEEAVRAAQETAEGKVSVEYAPPARAFEATFDRSRVLQVASILLDNAVKYTPQGGSVTVRLLEKDGRTALEVSDTGVGIPEGELPLVFERFHRVDPSRTDGGVGLGLSIARQIAESHAGEITVSSTPGEGSKFTLLLPKQLRPRT
jgi:two-component system OmpR family sensor kinase